MNIEIAIIGMVQALAVAIIGGLFARDSRHRKKALADTEAREALRAEESLLAMKMMSASVNLGISTATAIKNGKVNGIMNAALKVAGEVEADYQNFIKTVAVKQLADNKN